MSEHSEFKHRRREFTHREEESHSPVLDHEEREGGPARGVDGVARALALPATISSSVWHDEEEESKEKIKEGVKENSKWSTTKQDGQGLPKERDRRCGDKHSKMRPKR